VPLIALLKSAAEAVRQMSIEQLVANAGDGNLRDQSPASAELREYLAQAETKALAEYADHCLSRPCLQSD
jgi:hypothetical protein